MTLQNRALQNRAFPALTLAMAGVVWISSGASAEVGAAAGQSAPTPRFPTAAPQLSLPSASVRLAQFVEQPIAPSTIVPLTIVPLTIAPSTIPSVPVASVLAAETPVRLGVKVDQPIGASTFVPLPGSAETTASSLLTQPETFPGEAQSTAQSGNHQGDRRVSQSITPGRATRSGSSYFGLGGNIGFVDGSTAVGDGSFVILSKIGLTDRISFRPAVLFGDNVTFLLPVTYDFSSVGSVANYSVAPYVGGGLALNTDSDDTFNLLGTVGVDIPLGSQFTVNAALNVTFLNDVSFGLLLGLGYNF